MFNFKARDFFLGGFILGAIAVALIMLSILLFQSRSTAAKEPEPLPEEPTRAVEESTRAVEEATMAPEEPTVEPTATRAIDPDAIGLHYILLNPTRPDLSNIEVRQALRYAIDRSAVAQEAISNMPELMNTYPTGTMAPKFMQPEGLQNDLMLPYEPKRTQRMLEVAGWADNVDLYTAMPAGYPWLADRYWEMWDPLGIAFDYEELNEQGAIEAMSRVGVYMIPVQRYSTDPASYYRAILHPFEELSDESPELAEIMKAANFWIRQMEANPQSPTEAIDGLERLIVEQEALIIPVFRFGPAEYE